MTEHLLDDYKEVFSKPTGLPPSHNISHEIRLHSGTVQPYRYAHVQKDELEC
jgi:hypothetical protein